MNEAIGGTVMALAFMVTGAVLRDIMFPRINRQLRAVLEDARALLRARACYYYTDELRGPGAPLVKRIDAILGDIDA